MSDIQIYHVTFHDAGLEVVYSEERDIGDAVMVQRTIVIPTNLVTEETIDLMEAAQEAVDKGLSALLSPTPTRKRRIEREDAPQPNG